MCPDIMSTGFAGAEAANIKIGDVVAIFALFGGPEGWEIIERFLARARTT